MSSMQKLNLIRLTISSSFFAECAGVRVRTVGLRVGDELFVGSFAGDRILRVSLE